jgi:hypothetical protein
VLKGDSAGYVRAEYRLVYADAADMKRPNADVQRSGNACAADICISFADSLVDEREPCADCAVRNFSNDFKKQQSHSIRPCCFLLCESVFWAPVKVLNKTMKMIKNPSVPESF